jgi:reactive intermediate/imine deaminase
MKVHTQNPSGLPQPDGQFSQCSWVVAQQKMLFISGQVPLNAKGETVGAGNMTLQAEQVFQNLQTVLTEHGCSFNDVIKATLFVADLSKVNELMAVRSRFYGTAAPASTCVGVAALENPEWLLEVEMVVAA